MSNLREQLKEQSREREHATSWKPEPGDILEGTFERTQTVETRYGVQDVSHIRAADGTLWAAWHSHKVFREQWGEADPHQGDRVGVLYEGTRDGEQYTYHVYRVAVERADPEQDTPDATAPQEPREEPREAAAEEATDDQDGREDREPKVNPDGSFNFDAVSPGLPY